MWSCREPRPRRPVGGEDGGVHRVRGEGKIADRDHAGAGQGLGLAQVGQGGVAALVAEGVELLDIADLEPGLLGHEGPQRQLEGSVPGRVEGTDPRGFPYYWFGLHGIEHTPGSATDLEAIRDGFISVTPLQLDLTHNGSLAELAGRYEL